MTTLFRSGTTATKLVNKLYVQLSVTILTQHNTTCRKQLEVVGSESSGHPICGFPSVGLEVMPVRVPDKKLVPVSEQIDRLQTTDSLQAAVLKSSALPGLFLSTLAAKGVNVTTRRFAHTDVSFPDFDKYRLENTLDVVTSARETENERRALPIAVYYGVGGVMSLLVAKEAVQTMVSFKAMAADQKALASIEINMSDIPEGQTKTFEWRGKPVFVKHRTPEEISREKAVVVSDLRHPQHDDERVIRDEWSVVIGVCTHLGCVPIVGAGDYFGYYCPCHGSHYDGSGRIRKGPAPLNLHVPAYNFKENSIVIGTS
uniref:Rieske domain-containing protein n=2 Tax=Ascaris TaxID=6251 RepID=A0A0M3HQF3_ASCLU